MILIFLAIGTGVLATLLAAVFGDISFQQAVSLNLGLLAIAVGLAIVRFQAAHRHHSVRSQATQSARQLAQDAAQSWHTIAGTVLAIVGAVELLWSLHTLMSA